MWREGKDPSLVVREWQVEREDVERNANEGTTSKA